MAAKAKSLYVKVSPYKLRPIVNVIRGNTVAKALVWLKSCPLKKVSPITKVINSAYANYKNVNSNIKSAAELYVKEIKVDQGPIVKYYKPGAMGRASIQRRRFSHIEVIVDKISKEK